jgi:hypothetical protein
MNRRGFFGAVVGAVAASFGSSSMGGGCLSHLGVIALPLPRAATDRALARIEQKFAERNARSAVCVGARATRMSALVGRARPGDAMAHWPHTHPTYGGHSGARIDWSAA